jgi:hypothetical protein
MSLIKASIGLYVLYLSYNTKGMLKERLYRKNHIYKNLKKNSEKTPSELKSSEKSFIRTMDNSQVFTVGIE